MKKEIGSFIRALCFASLIFLVSVAYLGCHKQAGEGVGAGDITIDMGGGAGAGGAGTQGGAAAAPTVAVKLVRLDGTEMDLPATPVPLSVEIKLVFSEAMKTQSVEGALSLLDPKGNKVDGKPGWSADKMTLTFKPNAKLLPKTKYALKVSADAVSEAGTAIAPIDQTFTTMTPGDVNGDGVPDFVVGAPGADTEKGWAFVYSGNAATGGKPIAIIKGLADKAWFGAAVAIVGDMDADGYADVVVGAPHEAYQNPFVGAIYGFSGKKLSNGDTDTSNTDAGIVGLWAIAKVSFGAAVAGAGDLDNDGYDDLIVGSHTYSAGTGRVYIFSGKDFLKIGKNVGNMADTIAKAIITGQPNSYFGSSVAAAGDVDDDKSPEIIVGAPGALNVDKGEVYVFSSKILNDKNLKTTDALVHITGEIKSNFGVSVAGIGDIDGDNVDDMIVGAPFAVIAVPNEVRGTAYVFKGGTAFKNTTLTSAAFHIGQLKDERFGWSVAGIGDVDKDGKMDFVISAPYAKNNTGNIDIIAQGSISPAGEKDNDLFGSSVSGIGDFNNDGKVEYVVGAPGNNLETGAVYLYNSSIPVPIAKQVGTAQKDKFGASVSGSVK